MIKLEEPGPYAYEIDFDFCKGCGLCAAECPYGAIEMTPERNLTALRAAAARRGPSVG